MVPGSQCRPAGCREVAPQAGEPYSWKRTTRLRAPEYGTSGQVVATSSSLLRTDCNHGAFRLIRSLMMLIVSSATFGIALIPSTSSDLLQERFMPGHAQLFKMYDSSYQRLGHKVGLMLLGFTLLTGIPDTVSGTFLPCALLMEAQSTALRAGGDHDLRHVLQHFSYRRVLSQSVRLAVSGVPDMGHSSAHLQKHAPETSGLLPGMRVRRTVARQP